ncbi:hypothetical protein TNCV_4331401 [Trichonephila clavipes]|nr:hypothetical protein TNCV_4331401 [Trichonephila clavipes]
MVRKDARAPSEGATYASMTSDEAICCTRALLTRWRFSRRLVCRQRHEPGIRVKDITRIHWPQHRNNTRVIDEVPHNSDTRSSDENDIRIGTTLTIPPHQANRNF